MQDLFEKIVDNPSPSGNQEITEDDIIKKAPEAMQTILEMLDAPLSDKIDGIIDYALEDADKETFGAQLKEQFKDKMNKSLRKVASDLRHAIAEHYTPATNQDKEILLDNK